MRRLRHTALAIPLVVFVAAAALFLMRGNEGNSVAEAHRFIQQIPDQLIVEPGKVMYVRQESYFRHAGVAGLVAADQGAMPEHSVTETWTEFGPDSLVVRTAARVYDQSGSLVQEGRSSIDGRRTVDARTGAVLVEGPPMAPRPATAAQERSQRIEAALAAGTARILNQTDTTLEVEIREPVPEGMKNVGPGGYTVPYVADLDPVDLVTRLTLRNDGIVPTVEVFITTAEGEEILVQSQQITVHEFLDDMPDGLF